MCQHDFLPIESVAYVPYTPYKQIGIVFTLNNNNNNMFLAQQVQSIQGIRQGFCFLSSRHITDDNCFPVNKPVIQGTCLSSSFKSLASHKLGHRNASQALRARRVVGGGELVVGYSSLVVVRMTVIVWLYYLLIHSRHSCASTRVVP